MSETDDLAVEDLARSGLTPEQADAAGMYAVDDATEVYDDFKPLPALVIPYYEPAGDELMTFDRGPFARVRYLQEPQQARGFRRRKSMRYAQPSGSGVWAYFPQGTPIEWSEVYENPETPIVITEGEKKALRGCLAGVPTVGLGGVYNFMRDDVLLPELDRLCDPGRDFYICFDSDAATNPDIQAAEGRLATELSLKRGARVFLVRIPAPRAKKGEKPDKVGLDDFIVEHGEEKFLDLLEAALQMRKIDSAVLGLNQSCAWIETDGMIYDFSTNSFIKKHDFVSGSKYSALEMVVPTQKGNGVKKMSVAQEWLTHPHAQRFQAAIFDPTTEARFIKDEEGRPALNMWRGWDTEDGDVTPFLELSDFLFRDLPREMQDTPLNLMAYKAQHPGEKVPLALVLVGEQGCGKSLWARIVREAFSPYGVAIPSQALLSPFNGWVESSLICVIDEAQALHLTKGSDTLKGLISELRHNLNEKFRPARQVASYTSYILTSNDRRVGAYSGDDRRMMVIPAPRKREDAFYDRVGRWLARGGARHVMAWLLDREFGDWRPPKTAPLTSEKYLAYRESLSPIEEMAEDMRTADQHMVKMWIDQSLAWAKEALMDPRPHIQQQAKDTKTALERFQIRDFYTAEELAMIFPSVSSQLYGSSKIGTTTAGEISRQFRQAGIPFLQPADDPRGFKWRGKLRRFLVIANQDDWSQPISQQDFERAMKHFPNYGTKYATLDSSQKSVMKKHAKE